MNMALMLRIATVTSIRKSSGSGGVGLCRKPRTIVASDVDRPTWKVKILSNTSAWFQEHRTTWEPVANDRMSGIVCECCC